MSVEQNRANIQKNRRAIFELESQVNYVRAQAYLTRSTIQENALLINKNQVAAFWGNRQLANSNTSDLFANRLSIVRATPAQGPVQENFREALSNSVKLEFLDHRSKLNAKVLEISEKLASINEQLIQVNREIMAANQGIVEFNGAMISKNAAWLQNGIGIEGASPASNAELIASNAAKIAEIRARSDANKAALAKVLDHATANRGRILANTTDIYERRTQILANHSKIAANQQLVAQLLAKN